MIPFRPVIPRLILLPSVLSVSGRELRKSAVLRGMAAPFSSVTFRLKQKVSPSGKVEWTVVNDNGGYQKGESVVK